MNQVPVNVWKHHIITHLSPLDRVSLGRCSTYFHTLLKGDKLVAQYKKWFETCKTPGYIGDGLFYFLCKGGWIDVITWSIINTDIKISLGFEGACSGGHLKLAKRMEPQNNNAISGLCDACTYGHLDVVKWIQEGKDHNYKIYDLSFPLIGACASSRINIVQYILALQNRWTSRQLNDALREACAKGSVEIAILLIERGATNYSSGLNLSIEHNNVECAKLMISMGAQVNDDYVEYVQDHCNDEMKELFYDIT